MSASVKCKFDGCDRRLFAKGWCRGHYQQQWHGLPLLSLDPEQRFVDRFWARVQKTESCWLWTGSLSGGGYGRVMHKGRQLAVHRVSYEMLVGPIPAGLQIDHVLTRGCTHRNCVNPAHLEPVTARENTRRGRTPGNRWCAGQTWSQGEGNHAAKLTAEQVDEIRRLRASGTPTRVLAAQYRVSGAQVRNIISGRAWGHLTAELSGRTP